MKKKIAVLSKGTNVEVIAKSKAYCPPGAPGM